MSREFLDTRVFALALFLLGKMKEAEESDSGFGSAFLKGKKTRHVMRTSKLAFKQPDNHGPPLLMSNKEPDEEMDNSDSEASAPCQAVAPPEAKKKKRVDSRLVRERADRLSPRNLGRCCTMTTCSMKHMVANAKDMRVASTIGTQHARQVQMRRMTNQHHFTRVFQLLLFAKMFGAKHVCLQQKTNLGAQDWSQKMQITQEGHSAQAGINLRTIGVFEDESAQGGTPTCFLQVENEVCQM
jgi:hypothetical protein